jgi:signal transduction histidine kinase/CheY-like chemotaxis protein
MHVELPCGRDLVALRRAARRLSALLGFDAHHQIRITTAISELARGAAPGGHEPVTAEFLVRGEPSEQILVVKITGPGLREEARRHAPEAGERIAAAERLLTPVGRQAGDGDTTVCLGKELPRRAPVVDTARAEYVRQALEETDGSGGDELDRLTAELSATLLELKRRQQEVDTLNAELADTNRGVMALYAELDERANHLRRSDEIKTRFFSNMSHEFRTPLNSVLALASLLLDEADGPLAVEQKKQVRLIRDSAGELLETVSDLLDFAKVEAGKVGLNVAAFSIAPLFGALRGMIKPLLASSPVALDFGTAAGLPRVVSDEGKITQILRNFLSNAVKFTERGEIEVTARLVRAGEPLPAGADVDALEAESMLFCVRDTGIGICPEDQAAIFEEYRQVRHDLQRAVRGTGLGLPLCNRLASLLGGRIWVESEPGRGSSFFLLVPRVHEQAAGGPMPERDPGTSAPLLIVSDRPTQRAVLEDLFADGLFAPASARPAEVTHALLEELRPVAAVVDSPANSAVLEALRDAGVPLVTLGAGNGSRHRRRSRPSPDIVGATCRVLLKASLSRVLVVDDDDIFRAVLERMMAPLCVNVIATGQPLDALETAVHERVDCAVVDLLMPGIDGFELLRRFRDNDATVALPVLVCSSKTPSSEEHAALRGLRAAFLPKSGLEPTALERGLLEAQFTARSTASSGAPGRKERERR